MRTAFLSLLLHISLGLAATTYAQAPGPFSDVPVTHPNAEAIAYLHSQGVLEGYADGTFKPDTTISRAEFTKIATLSAYGKSNASSCLTNYPNSKPYETFTDVPMDAWYDPHVCLAMMQGVVQGYPDRTFRPQATVSFVQAAKIIAGSFVSYAEPTDVWYEHYVRDLAAYKAIPVSIHYFDQHITHGEMAEMIWRLGQEVSNKPSKTYEALSFSQR